MNNAKLMLAGLKQNPERQAKRGLDSDFVTKYEATLHTWRRVRNPTCVMATGEPVQQVVEKSLDSYPHKGRKTAALPRGFCGEI